MAVTPTSSANQTVASKIMAPTIKFFFMAISRKSGLALTFDVYLSVKVRWIPEVGKVLCDDHHVLRKRDRA